MAQNKPVWFRKAETLTVFNSVNMFIAFKGHSFKHLFYLLVVFTFIVGEQLEVKDFVSWYNYYLFQFWYKYT